MMTRKQTRVTRRAFTAGAASAAFAAPSILRAQVDQTSVRRNISSFRTHAWQDHFDALDKGIIIADTVTRVMQHWTADGEMRIYPTSVPLSDELTKRGYTTVTFKDPEPDWTPTGVVTLTVLRLLVH